MLDFHVLKYVSFEASKNTKRKNLVCILKRLGEESLSPANFRTWLAIFANETGCIPVDTSTW